MVSPRKCALNSTAHSPSLQGGGPGVLSVARLCSAFFSVLIMASEIFWGLCLGCFALAFNSFLSSEQ